MRCCRDLDLPSASTNVNPLPVTSDMSTPTSWDVSEEDTIDPLGTSASRAAPDPFGAIEQQETTTGTSAPSLGLWTPQSQQSVVSTRRSVKGGTRGLGHPKRTSRSGVTFGQQSRCLVTNVFLSDSLFTADTILEPPKSEHIEELLRKSLLGEEVVDTQFHLFSARSSRSGRVMKPRVVCGNNALLAKRSNYFLMCE